MNNKQIFKFYVIILIFFIFLNFTVKAQLLDSLSLDTIRVYYSINEALKEPQKVYKLSLRKKKLKKLPPEIFTLTNLQWVDLSKNNITEIPSQIGDFIYLQYLDLSQNKLSTLPFKIGQLKNLRTLKLGKNDVYALPLEIGNLENLILLDLWNNSISKLPETMSKLNKLKTLDMRGIIVTEEEQKKIHELLPYTSVYFSPTCGCIK